MHALGQVQGRAALAVSGGPDSLALLLLAHAAIPGQFEVATVDHGLREASAAEAVAVARVCADRGIEHQTLPVVLSRRGNLQANARAARYAALSEWLRNRQLSLLATAHHADDQAETLLMRLNRGAGVRGLAGMRPQAPLPGNPDLPLIRPLLGWCKSQLREVVAISGLTAAEDPSNTSVAFERVRIRQGMSGAPWLDAQALAASAARLADADAALDWAAQREWSENVKAERGTLTYQPGAPRAVQLRVLERIIAVQGTGKPRGTELARWLNALESGGTATLAGVKGVGRNGCWRFTAAPPHRR